MNHWIDSHAHIYDKAFDKDRSEVINKCRDEGMLQIYMPNVDHTSIDRMLETEARYPECVATMGLHPCSVNKDFEKELYKVEEWLDKRPFAAVGEIGIDLYWDKTFLPQQEEAFRIQTRWAKEKGIPVIIHCREAFAETLALVEELRDENFRGVFHCFTGTLEEAEKAVDLGLFLGIGGVATFKNGGLDKVLPHIDLKNLVLETDSPYLAPVPHRGKRNSPSYIPLVAQRLAELSGKSLEEVYTITTANTQNLFSAND
ncbi:TatD family hydrolase [Nafulsella turpanensis]|uniref:TatD family hydrolase n=1 Tax=Nafulsella turpanensis TaxID=1265690 RepID=UPI00036BB2FD|nr:TatD family hydrolase [Nafulsella turpanensis]